MLRKFLVISLAATQLAGPTTGTVGQFVPTEPATVISTERYDNLVGDEETVDLAEEDDEVTIDLGELE